MAKPTIGSAIANASFQPENPEEPFEECEDEVGPDMTLSLKIVTLFGKNGCPTTGGWWQAAWSAWRTKVANSQHK